MGSGEVATNCFNEDCGSYTTRKNGLLTVICITIYCIVKSSVFVYNTFSRRV